jgi:hypothetical protein
MLFIAGNHLLKTWLQMGLHLPGYLFSCGAQIRTVRAVKDV